MTSVGTCSLFNFALVSATENHKEELHDQSMEVFNESHCSDNSDKGITDDLVVHVVTFRYVTGQPNAWLVP